MKKFLLFLYLLPASLLLTSCSSLPEGAVKPSLQITDVFITSRHGTPGFEVSFRVQHHSPEELPVEEISIEIELNGRRYADFHEEPVLELRPGVLEEFVRFVPADQAGPAAQDALTYNSMLSARAYCKVRLLIDDDEENLDFNPEAEYRGIIYNVLSR